MSQLVTVAKTSDIPPGRSTAVTCGRTRIAIFNIEGEFYACSDTCPHAGAPLHMGFVRNKQVICPWHGWTFDLTVGPEAPPDGVRRYRVQVEDDEVKLELPD